MCSRIAALIFLGAVFQLLPPNAALAATQAPVQFTFAQWKERIDALPSNRQLKGRLPAKPQLALPTFSPLGDAVDTFFAHSKTGLMSNPSAWAGEFPSTNSFFNTSRAYFARPPIPFQPFVQKLNVPADSEIFFHGDLHGDVHSLVAFLQWLTTSNYLDDFTLKQPNTYLIFLGDYTDRGLFGVEVLYTLLRLKLANPERVLLVRGNHEDISLTSTYGFLAEATAKYGKTFDVQKVSRLYDFLPVALYLVSGTNAIQCNHGGMEPGFDPRPLLDSTPARQFQLLGPLQQRQFLNKNPDWAHALGAESRALAERLFADYIPQSPGLPHTLGFLWNDFSVVPGEAQLGFDAGRIAFIYGERATSQVLDLVSTPKTKVRAVFRAHQHSSVLNPMMHRLKAANGVFRHWQPWDGLATLNAPAPALADRIEKAEQRPIPPGSVWTFNVSPDSVYGEGCSFRFDTFGILRPKTRFEDWRLTVVNQIISK